MNFIGHSRIAAMKNNEKRSRQNIYRVLRGNFAGLFFIRYRDLTQAKVFHDIEMT